jgi:hypothetical protein
MHRRLRRRTRAIGTALVLMFVATLSVTCIAQAEMSAAEMACCAEMASECGAAMAQEHPCCQTTSARFDSQPASPRLVLEAPPLTLSTILALTFHETDVTSVTLLPRSSDSSPPGSVHPTYLLLSVFRI